MADTAKRCYYEVLGVSREATAEEIRSAYRRLALQLHPDKQVATGVSAAEATAAFQELVHAYEVLSDPKERSWYDSHRSQILFSDPKSGRSSAHFSDVDFYKFFSPSCFSGYSNKGSGFYKVYGEVFSKIHSQEVYFAQKLGLGLDSVPPAPLIGDLDSPYEQATAFYNYWLGFSTVMDFAWVDEYDALAGVNRRSRRFMEEENKKVRKKAKRERNELVRGLAAFAKKRDKRVIDWVVKKNQEEEERRAKEKAKREEEEKRKRERIKMYEEQEWAKIDEKEEEDDAFDVFDDERKKKKGKDMEFYCVACNKKFKSDKQWKNHEQSKKHKDKVAELRDAFEEEDSDVKEGVHVEFEYKPLSEDEDSDPVEEICDELRDEVVLEEKVGDEDGEGSDGKLDSGSEEDEDVVLEAMVSGRRNKKSERVVFHDSSVNVDFGAGNDEDDSMGSNTRRKGRKNGGRRRAGGKVDSEGVRGEVSETQQHNEAEVQQQEDAGGDNQERSSGHSEEVVARNKGNLGDAKSHKQKKSVVARKETVHDVRNSSKGRKQKGNAKVSNECGTCGESFDSRNKLFVHLGDSGHAMLKSR
ncbi:Dnaj-like subfamily a member 5 protein [Dioscorea alata]|uniref:Dnaj-like subfamily a member 5 protein n=1 Tax=Dioscorea alata TaxID=55571 RepID=A0ACB7TWC1_DIOAL|nr:Dnaj-like subfamily a member 5 protein [Dioscorea alata]